MLCYKCADTFIQRVERGKMYLLRIINAALNDELFFAIDNHTLTVVEADAVYVKPFRTKAIMVAPGQTTNVLVTTNQVPDSTSMFVMAARPYVTTVFPFNNSTTIGFLKYKSTQKTGKIEAPTLPKSLALPKMRDTTFAKKFSDKIRSLASPKYPCNVPKKIDKRVITTISLNLQDCPANKTCKGYANKRFLGSMNNQSFLLPAKSILESYYKNRTHTYSSDFPEKPPNPFNYTGVDPFTENMNTEFGTKLLVLPYGTNIEIVLQGTSFLNVENHPIHVHGHNFFIVGSGFGNFNIAKDPAKYNLVDPAERNTVAVPTGGWAAIRFKANNPGVWFIHCHVEDHTTWGLSMVFIVKNGVGQSQSLIPPPEDLPLC